MFLREMLDNALKYTPDGGMICLSIAKKGKGVEIIEENTCDPSLEPNPERLFERFYRGDAARTQKRKIPDTESDYLQPELFVRTLTEV